MFFQYSSWNSTLVLAYGTNLLEEPDIIGIVIIRKVENSFFHIVGNPPESQVPVGNSARPRSFL